MRWLKAFIYLSLLIVAYFGRFQYTKFSQYIELPERFEHTFFRALVGILIVEFARQVVVITYKPQDPSRKRDNFTTGVSHLSKVLYGLLSVALLISLFNVSLKEAIQSISLVAAAVVLMTKDYISNVITGMYLTFAKVINIGDQVMLDGSKGRILDITLTNVHLLNEDDDIVYVPNNKVFTSEIINYTRRELKKSSIDFEFDTELVKDVDEMEKAFIQILSDFSAEIQPDSYNLKVVSVKKEAIQFKFQFILREPLNKEIDKKVRRHFVRGLVRWMNRDGVGD